jgi:flavin reductase (DIM6/NTAB) family NADH-FMN oxidoreductase RutF
LGVPDTFTFADLSPGQRYKLLAGLIVPRPIALVTSLDAAGNLNAAPYSFFNCFGSDPALVILNVADRTDASPKDSAANAQTAGRFVVNLVDEAMAERMNAASADYPPGVSEPAAVGLATEACPGSDVPRLAESPASFACDLHSIQMIGLNRLVIGEVTHAAVREGIVDVAKLHVDVEQLQMVGRMSPPGWYCRTTDRFELDRPTLKP